MNKEKKFDIYKSVKNDVIQNICALAKKLFFYMQNYTVQNCTFLFHEHICY